MLHNNAGIMEYTTRVMEDILSAQSSAGTWMECESPVVGYAHVAYGVVSMFEYYSNNKKAEEAIHEGRISASDRREIMRAYDNGLRGYTYYER